MRSSSKVHTAVCKMTSTISMRIILWFRGHFGYRILDIVPRSSVNTASPLTLTWLEPWPTLNRLVKFATKFFVMFQFSAPVSVMLPEESRMIARSRACWHSGTRNSNIVFPWENWHSISWSSQISVVDWGWGTPLSATRLPFSPLYPYFRHKIAN